MSEQSGPALVLTAHELTVLEEAHVRGLASRGHAARTLDPEDAGSDGVGVHDAGPHDVGVHDADPQEAGQAQARRSLLARGLLSPVGLLPEGTDLGLLLETLLDVRLAAQALVVVERLLGEGRRDLRLLHLVAEGGVVEDIHPEGLHGLDLVLEGADLVAAVTEMVVPDDATAGDGPEVTLELSDVGVLPDVLRRPTVLAELTLVLPQGEETGHLVALGPGGCWAGRRSSGRDVLRLWPVAPGWVEELASSWVCGVVDDVVDDVDMVDNMVDGVEQEATGEAGCTGEGGTMAG